jgi:hypothetical protein
MPGTDRLSRELFPPPAAIRERLAENVIESRYLRRLLRVAQDAADERNRGRFAPDAVTSIPIPSPPRGA